MSFYENQPLSTQSSYSMSVDDYTFIVMRDYLYKLYSEKLNDPSLKVYDCIGIKNLSSPKLIKLHPTFEYSKICAFEEQCCYFFIHQDQNKFIISFWITLQERYGKFMTHYNVSINQFSGESNNSFQLFAEIQKKAVGNSSLKNQIIIIKDSLFTEDFFTCTEIGSKTECKLEDLFLTENITFHLRRIIYEIEHYEPGHKPFRYLLNGIPGTAKTQAINSVINHTYGKITVVIIKGSDYKFLDIFSFCSKLNPSLLVIDDLDFIAQDRYKSNSDQTLNDFLHTLDGLYSEPIFMLAATNDKSLVDKAASRPGRFDLIIDFSVINEEHYIPLMMRETNDQDIINLFTEEILNQLCTKKVTGAFIVNLVKQLKSVKELNTSITQKDLKDLISFTYDGFYDLNDKSIKSIVGF